MYTHSANAVIGGAMQFLRIEATTTALTTTAAARDAVMDIIGVNSQPYIVGTGYTTTSGSTSALLVVVPAGSWVAADLQTAVRATGLTGLSGATVTSSATLVG